MDCQCLLQYIYIYKVDSSVISIQSTPGQINQSFIGDNVSWKNFQSGDKMEMPGEGLCFLGSTEVRLSHTPEEGISFQDEP